MYFHVGMYCDIYCGTCCSEEGVIQGQGSGEQYIVLVVLCLKAAYNGFDTGSRRTCICVAARTASGSASGIAVNKSMRVRRFIFG